MTSSLEGRTAIVTGGSTLVGHGVVQALHEAGARVLVADIDAEGGAISLTDVDDYQRNGREIGRIWRDLVGLSLATALAGSASGS